MSNLIALDWDATELRAVIARTSGSALTVVDAVAKSLSSDSAEEVVAAIKQILADQSLSAGKDQSLRDARTRKDRTAPTQSATCS